MEMAICQNVWHHRQKTIEKNHKQTRMRVDGKETHSTSQHKQTEEEKNERKNIRLPHSFAQKKQRLIVCCYSAGIWMACKVSIARIVQNKQSFITIAISLRYLDFYWLYCSRSGAGWTGFIMHPFRYGVNQVCRGFCGCIIRTRTL